MLKIIFNGLCRAILISFAFLSSYAQPVQKIDPIVLQDEKLPFSFKEFYIADIIDERKDKGFVANLLVLKGKEKEFKHVDFQEEGLIAIRNFIRKNFAQNTTLRPIVLRIKEFSVNESPNKDIVEGHVSVIVSFDLQTGGKLIHLEDYRGGVKYLRAFNQLGTVEQALRHSLVVALRYINNWMDHETDDNPKLARGLKVFFKDYAKKVEGDTVYYAPDRPLTWNDFQSKPEGNRFAASVFPSFAYEEYNEIVNGILNINLILKVYVAKSASWVREATPHGLNHEQRHFDLVKIVAERFKKRILSEKLTLENYDGVISFEHIEALREMNSLQKKYDEETDHGTNHSAQLLWDMRIDDELKAYL